MYNILWLDHSKRLKLLNSYQCYVLAHNKLSKLLVYGTTLYQPKVSLDFMCWRPNRLMRPLVILTVICLKIASCSDTSERLSEQKLLFLKSIQEKGSFIVDFGIQMHQEVISHP